MNTQQLKALYEVLFVFAVIDGEIHEDERLALLDFVEKFDLDSVLSVKELEQQFKDSESDSHACLERFMANATELNTRLDEKGKAEVLDFVLDMIAADAEIVEEEGKLLNILLEQWGMEKEDLQNTFFA